MLLRLVAVLSFMLGLEEGGADEVPRRVWRRIIRLLRPAESAARRLIVLAALGLRVDAPKPRTAKAKEGPSPLEAAGLLVIRRNVDLGLARFWRPEDAVAPDKPAPAFPAFALTDPPRRFDTRAWDGLRPFPEEGFDFANGDEDVNARPLCRRLRSLKAALDDIEGHARRLARWTARQKRLPVTVRRFSPIRRGHPPGHFRRKTREIDDILSELHDLAAHAIRLDPG